MEDVRLAPGPMPLRRDGQANGQCREALGPATCSCSELTDTASAAVDANPGHWAVLIRSTPSNMLFHGLCMHSDADCRAQDPASAVPVNNITNGGCCYFCRTNAHTTDR
uniref:Uncharacterized protein n=1 Tax=Romanomermis culicivorax TaxID=13658 RepID=A0A915I5W3_ROMCU